MPKNGTQYRVFRYRLNVMSALENSPNSSDATHALGVNVRKSGILWPTIVYQARFNRTRLAIDIELLPDIFTQEKGLRGDSNYRFSNICQYHGATAAFQTPSDIEPV